MRRTESKTNSRQASAAAATEYATALHDAIDTIASAVKGISDSGYLLSCKISYGRVMAVGVTPARNTVEAAAKHDKPEAESEEM